MPKINFVSANGNTHQVDIATGSSVMEAAVQNNIPGITAECGGACACATCHVYVPEGSGLSAAGDMEKDMLEFAWEAKDNSRLSCQITVTDEMDGMTLEIPAEQA